MKRIVTCNKIFLIGLLVLGFATSCFAADVQWNPLVIYTIPADGNTYYTDFSKTLTDDLTISGTLEIRTGGSIQTDGNNIINSNTLTVSAGELMLDGGSITNTYNSAINVIFGGTFNIDSGALNNVLGTITINTGFLNLLSGTITNGGAATVGAINVVTGAFNMLAGTLSNGGAGVISLFGASLVHAGDNNLRLNSGTLTIPGSSVFSVITGYTFTIGAGTTLAINGGGTHIFGGALTIEGTGSLVNNVNGNLVRYVGATFTNGGTFTNNGNYIDFQNPNTIIPAGAICTLFGVTPITIAEGCNLCIEELSQLAIAEGLTLEIAQGALLSNLGTLRNYSENSVNISGKTYITGTIENGSASSAGTINVNYLGSLILAGGSIENKHAGSAININSGGSLYNYYGTVDIALGDVVLKAGGIFDNVRGNNPGSFTINAGAIFTDGSEIFLRDDLDIDFTWTITGNTVINGVGKKIMMGNNGAIVINPGASLKFEDVIISNLSGNQICCFDNTATLSLNNVSIIQDGDYSFTTGRLEILGDVVVRGNSSFIFEGTPVGATINDYSTILFNDGMTFEYKATANNLWQFAGSSSSIELNNSNLLASTACVMSTGAMRINGYVTLQGDALLHLDGLNDFDVNGSLRRVGQVVL